jgi:hypothetical protein
MLLLLARPGNEEPFVDVGQVLHDIYDQANYDLSIDYRREPTPPFAGEDVQWVVELPQAQRLAQ